VCQCNISVVFLTVSRQMLQTWLHFQHSLQSSHDTIYITKVAEKRLEIHSSGRYIDMKKGEVSKSLFLGYTDPADRSSKFLGNVGSHLPIQTASYPTLESLPTTLPEPHMPQRQNVLLSIAQPLSLSISRSLLGSIRNHTIKETTHYLMCLGIQITYITYNTKMTML